MPVFFEQMSQGLLTDIRVKWAVALLISVVLGLSLKPTLNLISKRWRKLPDARRKLWVEIIIDCFGNIRSVVVFLWIFRLFATSLKGEERIREILHVAVVLATAYQCFIWGMRILKIWRDNLIKQRSSGSESSQSAIGLIYLGSQTVLISLLLLLAMSNLGIDVGALVAGLGVGGIAVALAAQNILGDLLASLSIVFDKPFVIGDFISVGNDKGNVEHIGIKTTRVRSLSGEQLIFSNKDLLESRIQNYKRMSERRVVQAIGVVYSTPADVLEKIPLWVKEIVEHSELLRFDRCHFSSFGASSLDFEIVFWVLSPEFNVYMDLQQDLLVSIFRKFHREKVEFAFPTQTLYVEKIPQPNSKGI